MNIFTKSVSLACFIALLASVVAVVPDAGAAAPATVEGVRVWRAPERTRLVLDVSKATEHSKLTLKNPHRLVLDLKNARINTSVDDVNLKGSPIKKIRAGVRKGNDLRMVLDLKHATVSKVFALPANDQYGDRLVIDLLDGDNAAPRAKPIQVSRPSMDEKRDIVIALDAGHGGEDPGASGANGVSEKKVVLAIAKKLKAYIDKEPGFKAFLIRESDYFVALEKRPALAYERGADLMLSIHADAFDQPSVHGLSVYTLSERGSSKTARALAKRENNADLIGGATEVSSDVAHLLLDLTLTASKEFSERAGRHMVKQLTTVGPMHKDDAQTANFAVLRSPVPSLLIETGFISNPREAKLLDQSQYQHKVAKAIFGGVVDYFEDIPPEGSLLAWRAAQKGKSTAAAATAASETTASQHSLHVIRRGETLSGIAHRYHVSMGAIKSLNGLSSNNIRIGQKLKIPG